MDYRKLDNAPMYVAAIALITVSVLVGRMTAPKLPADANKWSKQLEQIKAQDSVLQLKAKEEKHRADSLEQVWVEERKRTVALTTSLAKAVATRGQEKTRVLELNDSELVARFNDEIRKVKASK